MCVVTCKITQSRCLKHQNEKIASMPKLTRFLELATVIIRPHSCWPHSRWDGNPVVKRNGQKHERHYYLSYASPESEPDSNDLKWVLSSTNLGTHINENVYSVNIKNRSKFLWVVEVAYENSKFPWPKVIFLMTVALMRAD